MLNSICCSPTWGGTPFSCPDCNALGSKNTPSKNITCPVKIEMGLLLLIFQVVLFDWFRTVDSFSSKDVTLGTNTDINLSLSNQLFLWFPATRSIA